MSLTLKDVILRIPRTNDNHMHVDPEDLQKDFDGIVDLCYMNWNKFNARFSSYWIRKWICTDSWVGTRLLTLDGVAVAIINQEGRKCSADVEYISKVKYNDVKRALLELSDEKEPEYEPEYVDMYQELDPYGYQVEFGSELLTKEVGYKGELCRVHKVYSTYADIDNWKYIVIWYNKQMVRVPMSEIRVPWGK